MVYHSPLDKIQMATFQKIGKRWRARIRRKGFPAQSEMFDTKAQAQEWASRQEADMRALKFQDVRIIADKTLGAAIDRYTEEQTQVKPLGKNKKAVLATLKRHLGKLTMPELLNCTKNWPTFPGNLHPKLTHV